MRSTGHDDSGRPARLGLWRDGAVVVWLIGVVACCSGCALVHSFPRERGRVLDLQTQEPIVGAAVLAEYETVTATVGGPVHQLAAASEVKTDSTGGYTFRRKLVFRPMVPVSWFRTEPCLYVFYPGYETAMRSGTEIHSYSRKALGRWTKDDGWLFCLPQLRTKQERQANLINYMPRAPRSKTPYYLQLVNQERKACSMSSSGEKSGDREAARAAAEAEREKLRELQSRDRNP